MAADLELTSAEQVVEADLRRLYAVGEPDAAFADRLAQRLAAQAATMRPPSRSARGWLTLSRPLRWSAVALAVFLILALAAAAVGPQRVWAQMQRLLGYVPGLGFVNLAETRVLPAPVEVTREGVTVRIEQAVAERDQTRIVLRVLGLPPGETVLRAGEPVSRQLMEFSGRLRLPDGATLDTKNLFLTYGEGPSRLEFAALPPDVSTFTLELDRLPLVPLAVAPEDWRIPLTLISADAAGVAENFPAPYRPDATDTHHGVTLTVENVAQTADETAITLRGTWTDPALEIHWISGGMSSPVLLDNVGHIYGQKRNATGSSAVVQQVVKVIEPDAPAPEPTPPGIVSDTVFEPLSVFARDVTLQIDAIQTEVMLDGPDIQVTIPEGAQVGTRWPLDITIDVAGFPLRFIAAAIETDRVGENGSLRQRTLLSLTTAPIPEIDGKRLSYFALEPRGPGWDGGAGSSGGPNGGITISFALAEGAALPSGPVTAHARNASVLLLGPWRMKWTVPGREGQTTVPATLHPAARDTHEGLTLAVGEVVHTDRLTHVVVDLENPPPGVQLAQAQVLWYDARRLRSAGLSFEDDRGQRYVWDSADIRWLRPGETYAPTYEPAAPGPQTFTLPAVDPLARRFTLSLPSIEVIYPGRGSFTVTVPAEVTMKDIPGAWDIQTSEPWPVDVALDAGGHAVRYAEATLNTQRAKAWVILTLSDGNAASGSGVSGLCGMTITGPDGQPVESAQNNFAYSTGPCAFAPGFAAHDEAGRLIPGAYRIEFDGVAARVAGPWRLRWEIAQ